MKINKTNINKQTNKQTNINTVAAINTIRKPNEKITVDAVLSWLQINRPMQG